MDTIFRHCSKGPASPKCLPAHAALFCFLAIISCNSGDTSPDTPENPDTPMTRPVELVTDTYTAYPSGENACVDSYLTLKFASEPVLGTSGRIRIVDSRGEAADLIDMSDIAAISETKPQISQGTTFTTAMDAVGSSASGYYRIVYYNAVSVSGTDGDYTVTIRLHSDKLEYGETYSVEIEQEALSVEGFEGISVGEWTFSVMPEPSKDGEVTVGERNCDFMTVQGAINFANSCGQSAEMTISVEDGIYEEPLYIRSKNNLTIKGESRDGTVIRFDNCNDYVNGVGSGVTSVPSVGSSVTRVGGRSVILVENCDMLRFENITLENSHGDGSQAEVIYFNSDSGRLLASGCNFIGNQDTIELKGWSLFRDCLVRGDVDFIWGYPKAALFERCEIRSCPSSRGYIVQARCGEDDKGIVFVSCDLTAESGVGSGSVYLARSGGNAGEYDNVTYIYCSMGSHIASSGWYSIPAPTPFVATARNGWKEFGSLDADGGSVTDLSGRYPGSLVLPAESAILYGGAAAVFLDCPHGSAWTE